MAYSDKDYFLTKISEAELNKLTAEVDENLAAAIASADSTIDSYLTGRVTVPLASPPEMIRQMSYDLAVFHLHDRIQYADIPERVKSKYDAAIFWLKDFARGQASIPGISGENAEAGVFFEVNSPKFGKGAI